MFSGLMRPFDRQVEADHRPATRLAFDRHLTVMHLDQGLGQGQAQACALGGLGVLALDLLERPGQAS